MKRHPRVALLVETSRGHGRQIIEGVARYAAEHGPWSLLLEPRNIDDRPPAWLANWAGDGLLVRCDSPQMAEAVRACGVPAIDLRGAVSETGLPLVGVHNTAIVDTAIEHLRQRGFRHFAYCDHFGGRRFWMDLRRDYFLAEVRKLGFSCGVFPRKRPTKREVTWTEQQRRELQAWLGALPRPVAILACDDEVAHQVLDIAQECAMKVPDDAAVLGIDNDEVFCRVSTPPLSSVDVNAVMVGYEAAAALARRMAGRRIAETKLVRPRGVVTRQSTDVVAVDQPEVAEAMRFIRENACRPLHADDVAEHLAVSRSTLERYLQAAVGHSATSAILQSRLTRVKDLLADTDLPLAAIASQTGFTSIQHLANLFRHRVGVTPGRFRRDMQHGSSGS